MPILSLQSPALRRMLFTQQSARCQNFGRTKEDEARICAIEEHKHDSLEIARSTLEGSYTYLDEVLGTLKDSDLELKGHHSKFGDQALAWFLKDFVTDHLILAQSWGGLPQS